MQNEDDVKQNEQQFQPKPKGKNLLLRIWLIISALAVIALVALIVLIATGNASVRLANTVGTGALKSSVCSAETVQKNNTIRARQVITADDVAKNQKDLAALATEVEQKPNYQTDATCLFIVYDAAFIAKNLDKAKGLLEKIEALANDGYFIDSRLTGARSIAEMQTFVDTNVDASKGTDFEGTAG